QGDRAPPSAGAGSGAYPSPSRGVGPFTSRRRPRALRGLARAVGAGAAHGTDPMSRPVFGLRYREIRRRIMLLTPRERVRWSTFFPLGVITATLETAGGIVVFVLIAALVGPATAVTAPKNATMFEGFRLRLATASPLTLTCLAAAMYLFK